MSEWGLIGSDEVVSADLSVQTVLCSWFHLYYVILKTWKQKTSHFATLDSIYLCKRVQLYTHAKCSQKNWSILLDLNFYAVTFEKSKKDSSFISSVEEIL